MNARRQGKCGVLKEGKIMNAGSVSGALALSGALLLGSQAARAAVTYVDATSGAGGNTTLSDGSTFAPPLNGTTGQDDNWEQRTVFGSGGNIYESAGEGTATENAPELRTTLGGLTAGQEYRVYALFWDPTSTTEDWNLRAGFAAGSLTLFSAADATAEPALTGAVAAPLASTLTYDTAPTIFSEGGRALLAADVGTAFADANGQLAVFLDDLGAPGTVNLRTWYDGVAVEVVPEPSSLGLLALAGLLAARRRRA